MPVVLSTVTWLMMNLRGRAACRRRDVREGRTRAGGRDVRLGHGLAVVDLREEAPELVLGEVARFVGVVLGEERGEPLVRLPDVDHRGDRERQFLGRDLRLGRRPADAHDQLHVVVRDAAERRRKFRQHRLGQLLDLVPVQRARVRRVVGRHELAVEVEGLHAHEVPRVPPLRIRRQRLLHRRSGAAHREMFSDVEQALIFCNIYLTRK